MLHSENELFKHSRKGARAMLETFSDVSYVSGKPLRCDIGGFRKRSAERMSHATESISEGLSSYSGSGIAFEAHPACPTWAWSWNSDTFTIERVDAGSGPQTPGLSKNWIANSFPSARRYCLCRRTPRRRTLLCGSEDGANQIAITSAIKLEGTSVSCTRRPNLWVP